MSTLTGTVPIVQHPDAATRETALALINRCMPYIAERIHDDSSLDLEHEAAEYAAEPGSPVATALRALVDTERASRTGGAR